MGLARRKFRVGVRVFRDIDVADDGSDINGQEKETKDNGNDEKEGILSKDDSSDDELEDTRMLSHTIKNLIENTVGGIIGFTTLPDLLLKDRRRKLGLGSASAKGRGTKKKKVLVAEFVVEFGDARYVQRCLTALRGGRVDVSELPLRYLLTPFDLACCVAILRFCWFSGLSKGL